jgi:hypothetical protein
LRDLLAGAFLLVMPGLDPGIRTAAARARRFSMDCRVKPGNDNEGLLDPVAREHLANFLDQVRLLA